MLTYAQLLEHLQKLTPTQLARPVALFDVDDHELQEVHGVDVYGQEDAQDVAPDEYMLDKGDVYLWCVHG